MTTYVMIKKVRDIYKVSLKLKVEGKTPRSFELGSSFNELEALTIANDFKKAFMSSEIEFIGMDDIIES